ncbi:apolipoprotein L2-like [Perognathus longimembris pacificus]|uniref:apolipoprotein L2-like n=1 Tax=Perognathus longimembris pacificus TaxID=214514 RepID=UPI00201A0A7B|nr:apolipoprotein L2-like [Perognathus longimembris pacificus]
MELEQDDFVPMAMERSRGGTGLEWKHSTRNLLGIPSAGAKKNGGLPRRIFAERVADFLADQLGPDYVTLLVTEDQAWEVFVSAAELSRDEDDELRGALKKLPAAMAVEDKDRPQKDLQDRKIFLQRFPQMKTETEGCIRRLRALADEVSKVHRDCTISNMVADSTRAASGLLLLLGLTLAPFTAGLSLGLSLGGMGLGAAASVSSAAIGTVEGRNRSSVKAEASNLVSDNMETLEDYLVAAGKISPEVVLASDKFVQLLRDIGKHIHALSQAKANPQVLRQARGLMNTWRSSRGFESVERASRGTALAMTRGPPILGVVPAGVLRGLDMASPVQGSQHLSERAESELAAELRRVAQELESRLELLVRVQRELSSGPAQ